MDYNGDGRLDLFVNRVGLYRGDSGRAFLVGARCAHRRTVLHTGWVQGEEVRCIYHGWKFSGAGQCTEAPAEGAETAAKIRIKAYPVREYCGLVFAYLGAGAAPEFDLPRKPDFEKPGLLVIAREQIWPTNFFQMIENSLDAGAKRIDVEVMGAGLAAVGAWLWGEQRRPFVVGSSGVEYALGAHWGGVATRPAMPPEVDRMVVVTSGETLEAKKVP